MQENDRRPTPGFSVTPRRPEVAGTVLRAAGTAAATVVVAVTAAWLSLNRFADQRAVTWAAALAVPILTVAVTLRRIVASAPERRRRAAVGVAVFALAGGGLVLELVGSVRPAFPKIAATLPDSDLPAGYHRIREERRGDRLCRDDCPRILRYYRVPAGTTDPVRDVVLALYRHGWTPEDPLAPRGTDPAAFKDGVRVHVRVIGDGTVQVYLDADAR